MKSEFNGLFKFVAFTNKASRGKASPGVGERTLHEILLRRKTVSSQRSEWR